VDAQPGPAIQDLVPHNNCWGCGPSNDGGLQIKSYVDGDTTICDWQPGPPYFAGPEHVLNGGIIATLLDCHSVCTAIADVYRSEGREIGSQPDIWCVTAAMDIKYLKPVALDQPVRLVGTISKRGDRSRGVQCTLYSSGEECARAEVVAVRVADEWRQGAK
jgi:acyl-coenzyme A thioesterase PaaI-like protein